MEQERVFLSLGVEVLDDLITGKLVAKVAGMINEAREEGVKAGLTMSGGKAAVEIIEHQIEWRQRVITAIRCELDAAQDERTSEALKRLQAIAES